MAIELRPYQKTACDYCFEHLLVEGNSLLVAPTGSGKTMMFSDVAKRLVEHLSRELGRPAHGMALIGQTEIHLQNLATFNRYAPHIRTAIFDSNIKSCRGNLIFAMIGSIFKYRKRLPMFDFVVIDESHHALAPGEFEFINELKRKNPKLLVFGVTATPNRGDQIGLLPLFTNFYRIPIRLLFDLGYLVKPTFKVFGEPNLSTDDGIVAFLKSVQKHRKGKTVIFCGDVESAIYMSEKWNNLFPNEQSVVVHGELNQSDRASVLDDFKRGIAKVIFNVAVLTEGFDDPEIETGVLVRHYGTKGRYIQAVGRVLRPCVKIVKNEAFILDYGGNYEEHGGLQEEVDLVGSKSVFDRTGRHLTDSDLFEVAPEPKKEEKQIDIVFTNDRPRFFKPYETELDLINWFDNPNGGGIVGAFNGDKLGVIIIGEDVFITHDKEIFEKSDLDTVKSLLSGAQKPTDSAASNYQLRYLAGRYNIATITKNRANAVILFDLFCEFVKK